jgi:hypothetical protein
MARLATGQGYSILTTDEQIIAQFTRKYGYAPVSADLWIRNNVVIIVPLREEIEDGPATG